MICLFFLFFYFFIFEIWWIRNADKRVNQQSSRRCDPTTCTHMLFVLSVGSFWWPFVWHGQKPRLLFSIPPWFLFFFPFKRMGSAVEIDIHLTVQPRWGRPPLSAININLLGCCIAAVWALNVSRPYFSFGVEREGASFSRSWRNGWTWIVYL